jgi:hypothetical protein
LGSRLAPAASVALGLLTIAMGLAQVSVWISQRD